MSARHATVHTGTIRDVRALADHLVSLSRPFDSGIQGRITRLA